MSPRLSRLLLAAVAVVASAAIIVPTVTARQAGTPPAANPDAWLDAITAPNRMLFDANAANGGVPLAHVMNYYNTFNTAYGVPDRDVDAIFTLYGQITLTGLNDAMWAKYRLGEFLGERDAAGALLTANPWRTAPTIMGGPIPAASIESLQKRGATFILCNNALTIYSSRVAAARNLDPARVYEEMKANILPNVTLVPAMVIAIDRAQQRGISYHKQ
jgi:intracellular sulfur oxidation DsrE/DsrF family protein